MVLTRINVLPSKSLECKNLLSTKKFPDDVTKLVDDELRKGYLIGPFTKPLFDTYRISPIGIVEGKYSKKKRLILDLSAPHNNDEHHSINDLINKEDYSLTYVGVDDAISIIKSLRIKSQLCKCDVTDAFKLIPVHNSLWRFYGLKWNDMYYFYTRLAFGFRSSSKIFDTLSVAICWILQNNYGLRHVLHLLDDFLLINNPYVDATRYMNTMLYVFNSLKIPLSAHKTVGPSTSLEYLGIILDSMHMIAKLPDEKLVRIKDILYSYLYRRSCTKHEMLSLLGHLNYACKVIIPGRSFVSYLLTLAHSVKELNHHVTITKKESSSFDKWIDIATVWLSHFTKTALNGKAIWALFNRRQKKFKELQKCFNARNDTKVKEKLISFLNDKIILPEGKKESFQNEITKATTDTSSTCDCVNIKVTSNDTCSVDYARIVQSNRHLAKNVSKQATILKAHSAKINSIKLQNDNLKAELSKKKKRLSGVGENVISQINKLKKKSQDL
ncbi:unnamed protein product [Mytilus coruscus]|uniref:Reverse transcriptase domain-containing protein n=1 Tax=Mytilus coruscus TaxID=42192 RepID=A0A6J8AY91_MYTCO|nr:unnamed protein product [Mytilus coruscus]